MVPAHVHICWHIILINEIFVSFNVLRTLQLIKGCERKNSTGILCDTIQDLKKPVKHVCQNSQKSTMELTRWNKKQSVSIYI